MKFVFLFCVAALALVGCAGLVTPFINNPFAGTYSGTFTDSDGKTGPASIQLTKLGNVFGTLKDTASGASGNLNGSVGSNLSFSGTVSFPGSPTHNVSGTLTSTDKKITGTLKGTDYTLTVTDATKQ